MNDGGEAGSVRVVGTAHVSEASVREVEDVIEADQPDVVAVELDEGRFRQLKGETPEELDAGDLLRGNTVFQFLAYWMLSYVQARLGDRFDIEPGADMKAAVDTAEDNAIDVALVDRDIQVTFQRFWARLSTLEKLQLVAGLAVGLGDPREVGLGFGLGISLMLAVVATAVAGPFVVPAGAVPGILVAILDTLLVAAGLGVVLGLLLSVALARAAPDDDVEEFDVDRLTNTDVVGAMMEEFRRFSPGGAAALIDERDAYIAHKLLAIRERGHHVVAVVGAGHRDGVEAHLERPETLPSMSELTGRTSGRRVSLYRLFGYLFTLGFFVFFVLLAIATYTGVEGTSSRLLFELFAAWFLVNGVVAFVLAKLAGAHWSSAGVGGGVAWLTSVNPLLAPGWFAGYVELRYIDVNVGDIGRLNEILDDEESPIADIFARMRQVPLFRLILIAGLTNVGSMIASLVVFPFILPWLSADVGGVSAIGEQLLRGARTGWDIVWRTVA